jgi:methionyl-tRNA formyltransferase
VVLVLTHRAGFSGLGEPDVEWAADELGIPIAYSATAAEPGLHERLRGLHPQVIVSTNWRTKVPAAVLRIPERGAINVHDALLPEYSGFGAVNWAIRNGEDISGLTVHYMDEELDTGPVILQSPVKIGPHDTAGQLLDRLVQEYVPAALCALELVEQGDRGVPQPEGTGSFYHRIGVEDTRIDWQEGARTIYNLIRGQSDPFVNAWTTHDGFRLWIKAAALPDRSFGGTPGRVVKLDGGGVAISCGRTTDRSDRGILLLQVALDGTPPVRAIDYPFPIGSYLR